MQGFYRVALCAPETSIANPNENADQICALVKLADKQNASIVLTPELSLSAYSCGDLFFNSWLIENCVDALFKIAEFSNRVSVAIIVGCPIQFRDRMFNTAVVIYRGEIKGIVPKTHVPEYREFYEKRWFASAQILSPNEHIVLRGCSIPFGRHLLFSLDSKFCFGVEICEDLWSINPPSIEMSCAGAELILNLSASNELIAKSDFRRLLVQSQSARTISAYAYASCGSSESSSDLIYAGHLIAAENGALCIDSKAYSASSRIEYADFDLDKLRSLRSAESVYKDYPIAKFELIELEHVPSLQKLLHPVDPFPFVPKDFELRGQRCEEVLNMQVAALSKRLDYAKISVIVLGVSGGLDSCWALMVASELLLEYQRAGKEKPTLIGVSMPGFATSDRTKQNAKALITAVGAEFIEIDITKACKLHLGQIGHDEVTQDLTYENAQARERTQILMDLANKRGGLVLGTGDLSELALGWCTFNGDHMSMYGINCGVPKTLIRHLLDWYCQERAISQLGKILRDVLDTPVSPELTGAGLEQRTEDIIGPYDVLDFFLFHFIRYGATPGRILYLAENAFATIYTRTQLENYLHIFFKRFFAAQFKRNCMPDGPKIGTVSLSPRADWRMPSDAVAKAWLLNHAPEKEKR